jgi:hypothetical protein
MVWMADVAKQVKVRTSEGPGMNAAGERIGGQEKTHE